MRLARDRLRHAIMFEVIALALVIPLGARLFGLPSAEMGLIGVASSATAAMWNYVYNAGFDRVLMRVTGHARKGFALRVAHAVLFEAGLLAILLPPIAWYLGIGLVQAFVMDLSIAAFYVCYGFAFNLAYDHLFPVAGPVTQRA